jgi:membrane fusion protein (multidrug efflux system)
MSIKRHITLIFASISVVISSIFLVGCGDSSNSAAVASLPLVVAEEVAVVPHQRSKEYVGRMSAVDDVTIAAQVTGYLASRHFIEGELVKKDQLLYQIEDSSFKAQVASAKAAVAQAEALLIKAQLDFDRGENLLPKGNISQADFDGLTATLLGAEAQVQAAKAQLHVAEVNLSYTQITAPIDGRISQSEPSIGDLLSPSSGILTSIVSLDPIHASFNVSERERIAMGMEHAEGTGNGAAKQVSVELILEDDSLFPQVGEIDFVGNRIELATGTIDLRARFANPNGTLLPGQHVKVVLKEKESQQVIAIPRRAVQSDLEGDYVMVLLPDNIAERRNVSLGSQTEHGVVIQQGLSAGESVIIKGLQRVRNGSEVRL